MHVVTLTWVQNIAATALLAKQRCFDVHEQHLHHLMCAKSEVVMAKMHRYKA